MPEAVNNYPREILVSSLARCHPDYSGEDIECAQDLYEGGKAFESRKDRYLRVRGIEQSAGGAGYRKARLACAYYTPHAGGIIDNLIGSVLQAPPKIEITKGDDPRAAYWTNLNSDCDGRGRDLRTLTQSRLKGMMLFRRAYIYLERPSFVDSDLETAKKLGAYDIRIKALDAADVDDWEHDDDGNLLWVRVHAVEQTRSAPYAGIDTERHTWTFIDAAGRREYVAARQIKNGRVAAWKKESTAAGGDLEAHGFSILPVIPIDIERGFVVLDRLKSTILAHFNRESSREFALDTGALNLPIIKTDRDVANLMMSELSAIKLGATNGEDFFFRSPDAAIFNALKEDCDYLLGNLYSAIHAMALRAASQQENARQSGVAKFRDQGPMEVLMSLFAAPLVDAFEKVVRIIADMRQETELGIRVSGLDRFDIQSMELEINKATEFINVPGMMPTAKREAAKEVALKYLAKSSPEIIAAVNKEAAEAVGVDAGDDTGKILPALQQMALARQRFIETGDTVRAERVAKKMDALLAAIETDGPGSETGAITPSKIRNPSTQEPAGYGKTQMQRAALTK